MSELPRKAVFLSYASQDAEAARRICDALRAAGVEVWFDQNELVGGDAWDAKIRKQIKECALFVPVISAATQARHEGYFRLEWKLAAERTHMMSGARAFLLPVVIDATRDADAHVPPEFRTVQWTRIQQGKDAGVFAPRVKSLLEVGSPTSLSGSSLSRGPTPAHPVKRAAQRRSALATFAALVILATVLGGGWWWKTRQAANGMALSENSIAVLAFKNLSPDKSNEYFSDGVSEEIGSMLGRVPGLRVAPTASTFQFKEKRGSLADIGRQLNVTYLVDGSVQKDGDRLRIRAQLVRAQDGFSLWTSENLDRDAKDILKVQEEIATLITRALRLNLRFAFAETTVRPEAYQLYLRGRQAWNERAWRTLRGGAPREELPQAKRYFQSAIELDPKFGRAYAGLADVLHNETPSAWAQRASPRVLELVRVAEIAVRLPAGIRLEPKPTAHCALRHGVSNPG